MKKKGLYFDILCEPEFPEEILLYYNNVRFGILFVCSVGFFNGQHFKQFSMDMP